MNIRKSAILGAILVFSLYLVPYSAAQRKPDPKKIQARLVQRVRHELIMLLNYGEFDLLEFKTAGLDTVILSGQVVKPALKRDAENAIRNIEAVRKVINKIEVLPLSSSDDRIRVAVHQAIFSKPGMDKYRAWASPPIHVIVKNGTVTLFGVVQTRADKDLVGIAAREVPGTFGVINKLRTEK
jgi:hyperosmotically inducible protein